MAFLVLEKKGPKNVLGQRGSKHYNKLGVTDDDMGALYSKVTARFFIWAFGLIWFTDTCCIAVKSLTLYWYPSWYCEQVVGKYHTVRVFLGCEFEDINLINSVLLQIRPIKLEFLNSEYNALISSSIKSRVCKFYLLLKFLR